MWITLTLLPTIFALEIAFEHMEVINNTRTAGYYFKELRVTKFNRTTYVLNAKFDLYYDMDNDYAVKMRISFH